MTGGGVQGDRASWRGCQSPPVATRPETNEGNNQQSDQAAANVPNSPHLSLPRRRQRGSAQTRVSAVGFAHINLPFIPPKCPHYMSVTSERLRETSRSRPVFAPCHFLRLLLLIPAGEIRRSGASIIAPRAHRGVLSHTEIHISASFNLGCGSLSHIYDCS